MRHRCVAVARMSGMNFFLVQVSLFWLTGQLMNAVQSFATARMDANFMLCNVIQTDLNHVLFLFI